VPTVPIEYCVNHKQRIVVAWVIGSFSAQDMLIYQHEVWSRPDVAGYDELVDMTDVREFVHPTPERIRELALLSASMDVLSGGGKFAIVAPRDLAFGLGRMYETYRALEPRSTKEVGVFRTRPEALAFLCLAAEPTCLAARTPA
jgi:hypothetical protein